MQEIIRNALTKLNKNSTLDEIKTVLKGECKKVNFKISNAETISFFPKESVKVNINKNHIIYELLFVCDVIFYSTKHSIITVTFRNPITTLLQGYIS